MLQLIPSPSARRGSFAIFISAVLGVVLFSVSVADELSTAETSNKARRLEQMLERAKRASIRIIGPDLDSDSNDQSQTVELSPQPLFRYDDQPRGFRDGTLWMWSFKGRPIAIEKVEDSRDAARGPTWVTCLTSVSPRMIRATWEGGYDWNSKKPGINLRLMKDGPKPEANETGRLRQFKELLRHFSVSMQLYTGDRQELRLLPRQLHRYQIPSEHVADAVIFGWTANGTNPDALLIVELHTLPEQAPEWVYSLAPVTADKLWLKYDDTVVQTKDQTIYPSDDTLIFFFEKNSETID